MVASCFHELERMVAAWSTTIEAFRRVYEQRNAFVYNNKTHIVNNFLDDILIAQPANRMPELT